MQSTLTTEKEARTKWCPFVRVAGGNRLLNTITDGFANTNASFHCIGSECMAWRTQSLGHTKRGFEDALHEYGFCGLAGRPDYPEAGERERTGSTSSRLSSVLPISASQA